MKEEIFEPALADEKLLQRLRQDPALRAAYGAVPAGYSRLTAPRFDMGRVWKLMEGAIDVHIHPGPDACNARLYDELEIAIQACRVGMKAVVYKGHSMPSARSAYFVQKAVDLWAEQHNKSQIDVPGGVKSCILGQKAGSLTSSGKNLLENYSGSTDIKGISKNEGSLGGSPFRAGYQDFGSTIMPGLF